MEEREKIINRINELVLDIETNYPELYPFLDENPLTLAYKKDEEMTVEVLRSYLETTEQWLKRYKDSHQSE
ncbi:hypothetical protein [Roseivirga sp.]|uniref:hypothetical protein n=1 Tax=Roseivirga sp. TaxID=1964215 RepID=UPI003B51A7CD